MNPNEEKTVGLFWFCFLYFPSVISLLTVEEKIVGIIGIIISGLAYSNP